MDKLASGWLSVLSPRDVRAKDLANLLLWRLRGITLIFLAACALGALMGWFWPRLVVVEPTGSMVFFLLFSVQAAWLFSRPAASVRALRVAEAFLFGQMALVMSLVTIFRVTRHASGVVAASNTPVLTWALESTMQHWCILIVLYGTWIPNTGRRCTTVVGVLVALALGVLVAVGVSSQEVGRVLFGPALLVAGFWVGSAAAIAVYGSHWINLLSENLATARTLGPYQVVRKLGSGGMGEVYLARHQHLERPCAIKVIRRERVGDETTLHRFEREVQVLAQLTHWNIVEIFDVGHAADGTFYFAMEYLPGLTWQELVDKHGPLPPARVLHLLRQACAALRDVHAAGLVHRDVKPVNLLVCVRGCVCDVVKLLDFGIVKEGPAVPNLDNLTPEGRFLGTPLYVSPDQVRARETLDGRSDLYALGAVAYFLLTGEPPFIRDTVPEILVAHLKEDPVLPSRLNPAIPSDLETIVLRCLEKVPERRFANAAELSHQLSTCSFASSWTDRDAEAWWREHCPDVTPPS